MLFLDFKHSNVRTLQEDTDRATGTVEAIAEVDVSDRTMATAGTVGKMETMDLTSERA